MTLVVIVAFYCSAHRVIPVMGSWRFLSNFQAFEGRHFGTLRIQAINGEHYGRQLALYP